MRLTDFGRYRIIAVALVIGVCGTSLASAQSQNTVRFPPEQRSLSSLQSRMVELYHTSQNKADVNYFPLEKAFCAAIPRGSVSGWVGKVVAITDQSVGDFNSFTVGTTPPEGMLLLVNIATTSSQDLLMGNFYWMGIAPGMTTLGSPPLFAAGSTLNKITLGLKPGDTIIFSGSFIPFKSDRDAGFGNAMQSCEYALNKGNYFSMFRFSSISKVGSRSVEAMSPNNFLDHCVTKMVTSPEYALAMAHPEMKVSIGIGEDGIPTALTFRQFPTPPPGESQADIRADAYFQTEAVALATVYRQVYTEILKNGSPETQAAVGAQDEVRKDARLWCTRVTQPGAIQ